VFAVMSYKNIFFFQVLQLGKARQGKARQQSNEGVSYLTSPYKESGCEQN
jgi:hypothetical protein